MANHVLRLVDTGVSGTVNLTDWADYSPQSPQIDALDYEPAGWQSGGERPLVTRRNVDETCRVWFDYSTTAAIRGTINYIEQMFARAEHRQSTGMSAPVYVQIDPGTSGTVYRSELLSGRVELDPDALKNPQWDNTRIGATLHWRRRWYWEGPETTLTLANGHGTATTGVTVYNHNYEGGGTVRNNWVTLTDAGSNPGGVVPSPIKLRLTNNSGTSISNVWLAHNAWSYQMSTGHTLECESASGGGTATADATCSGGQYLNYALGTAVYAPFYWSLSPTLLSYFAGNWVTALLRFRTATVANAIKYYIGVYLDGAFLYPLWTSTPRVISEASNTINLGSFRLPPGAAKATGGTIAYQAMRLAVQGISNTGWAFAIQPDVLMLLPSDSFRQQTTLGAGSFFTATRTIDDMITGDIYNDAAGTAVTNHITPLGGDIELWPARAQRLYCLFGGLATHGTVMAEAWYRPRRLTF